MPDHYNPYHFVPATGMVRGAGQPVPVSTEPFDAIRNGSSRHPARHDRWVADTHSGRIICRLTLERPTIVGGEQQADADDRAHGPKTVIPYRRVVTDAAGKSHEWPAIPGSSLRGLVSSVAEALSQSTLRVLADTQYSARVKPGNERALSALGYLIPAPPNSGRKFDLVPVALPTLERGRDGTFVPDANWGAVFGQFNWQQVLPAYVDGYDHAGLRTSLRPGSFLARENAPSGGFRPDEACWWYALTFAPPALQHRVTTPLPETVANPAGAALHVKDHHWLLGLSLRQDERSLLPEEAWRALPPNQQRFYTRGVLRVLGIEGREDQLPPTKKHELFIPHPEGKPAPWVPVPDVVVETFHRIAQDRHDLSKGEHPFALRGRDPATCLEARPYELYYFNVATTRTGTLEVSEIAVSAVWRRAVGDRANHRADSAYDFFDAIRPGLTPLRRPENEAAGAAQRPLTPAELLFGVVSEGKDEGDVTAAALASRLRVHDAIAMCVPLEAPTAILLKTLSSPKPPSPALYFTPKPGQGDPGQAIRKGELNKDKHRPQGRKFYLHHQAGRFPIDKPAQWSCVTRDPGEHDHLRLRCTPLLPDPNNPFYFHIDFDNLGAAELALLLTSLRPAPEFRHRLGLGKPLGLGTVRIDIEAVFFVDREARYSPAALDGPRYHRVWSGAGLQSNPSWQRRWPREAAALGDQSIHTQLPSVADGNGLDRSLIDFEALAVLCKLGDPDQVLQGLTVHTPLTAGQLAGPAAQQERETFKWFVANDHPQGPNQGLRPVDPGQPLPTLTAHPG